eukprot:jgi/Psemu1/328702/estExt_fgenesh1_pg.C_19900002
MSSRSAFLDMAGNVASRQEKKYTMSNENENENENENLESGTNETRNQRDYAQQDDFTGPSFVDHFSLREPSSTVRFRGTRVHVYNTPNEQILLEHRCSSKDAKSIILFLFVNLASDAGLTSDGDLENAEITRRVVTTFLSVPVFLFGISSLMAIATTFVSEAASGGYLIRAVFGAPPIVSELLYFVFFLMIPAITFISALFVRVDNPLGNNLLRMARTQKYSGGKNEQYVVTAEDVAPKGGYTFSDKHEPVTVKRTIYSRITQLGCLRFMYDTLDMPQRTYTIEEVRDVIPFVTKHTFSLEAMFFNSNRKHMIINANGPSALTRKQVLTGSICNLVATILIMLGAIAYLVWMSTGWTSYILVGMVCVACCLFPFAKSQKHVVHLYSDMNEDDLVEDGGDQEVTEEETTLYRLWETSRVVQPKAWACYVGMLLEFVFLFLIPIYTLFVTGNNNIGVVFLILSFFSFVRKYFDAAAVLCELGSMSSVDLKTKRDRDATPQDIDETMLKSRARLAEIAGNISRSQSVTRWMWFFGSLVVFTFLLFSSALESNDGLGDRPPIILVDDFAYPGEDSLQYPTCAMTKGFRVSSAAGEDNDTALGDYSFLSALAYETTDVTSYILPQWFPGVEAIDEDTKVNEYREQANNKIVPVYFKLFTFPAYPDTAVLAIRGSQTSWDWMVNMQLWSASALAQIVKWILPFGWIWTPILDDLVWFISLIQSERLAEIAYYKVTTNAAKHFKNTYSQMRITGASLGGGLAIMTGAQAKTPSVAISGLGVELSRNSIDPRVTMDDINKYVFNFIPDRDFIARIGGRPRQHQEGHCSADYSNLFGCHSMWRSVCEINYRCGSNGRPVPCRCVFNFGYPEPEPIGDTTRSFQEACFEQEQAFLAGTGSTVESGWW